MRLIFFTIMLVVSTIPGFGQNRRDYDSATSANVTGRWTWIATCQGSTSSGRFEITSQRPDGDFLGAFSNANPTDTGSLNGQQRGLLVEFLRQIPGVGEQQWTGGVERNGARMEGKIEGVGGPCAFSATSTAGTPRKPGSLMKITGQWNWTAACGASGSAGRFQIVNQGRDGDFSGAFSNASPGDTGTINGKQRGLLVEFQRQIPDIGEQQWTGGLSQTGRELMMEGRIEGPGGPCTFRATAGR
jgi:hypothetical protein